MRKAGGAILVFILAVGSLPMLAAAQARGQELLAASEDQTTTKWKQSISVKLDEIVKEAERTGNARLMELARQIRETVSKVRKIENGGNGG